MDEKPQTREDNAGYIRQLYLLSYYKYKYVRIHNEQFCEEDTCLVSNIEMTTTQGLQLKQKPTVYPQVLTILSASLCSLIFGLYISWPSPAIPQLIAKDGPYRFTLEECSYLMVIPQASMVITGFAYATLADRIGRKFTILITALPFLLATILIAVAENLYLLYLARAFSGMGDACMFSTLLPYIGEIATPEVRGLWGNCPVLFAFIGQVFINAVGGYLDVKTTAWITLVFPTAFTVTFSFAPESPYFYIMKGKTGEARKMLQKLRARDNVEEELSSLQTAVERQMTESCTWKELFTNPSNRKGLAAGVFLRVSQMLSGIACFSSYMQYIFTKSSASVSAVNASIIFNVALTVSSIIATSFLDKLGRRMVMIVSSLGCGLCLVCASVYFYLEVKSDLNLDSFGWVPLCAVLCWVIAYSFGLATVPTLMLSELFSANVKRKALPIMVGVMGFWVGVTTKLFHLLDSSHGLYAPFMFFAVCCICNGVLSLCFVPETKGKTLEEIQLSLKK